MAWFLDDISATLLGRGAVALGRLGKVRQGIGAVLVLEGVWGNGGWGCLFLGNDQLFHHCQPLFYPEKINEPVLRGFLFLASIVGASLGVIFSVYRQRFGDSL